MPRRHLIQLPEGVNPGGLLTIKNASKISNIPESTIRGWRRQPGNGLTFYRVGGRIFLKCDEFIAWVNLVAVEVSQVRRFSFSSESNIRGMEAPEAAIVNQTRVPVLHRGR